MATPGEVLQNAIQAALSTAAPHWDAAAAMHQEVAGLRGRLDASQKATRPAAQTSLIVTSLVGKADSFDGGAGWKQCMNTKYHRHRLQPRIQHRTVTSWLKHFVEQCVCSSTAISKTFF